MSTRTVKASEVQPGWKFQIPESTDWVHVVEATPIADEELPMTKLVGTKQTAIHVEWIGPSTQPVKVHIDDEDDGSADRRVR